MTTTELSARRFALCLVVILALSALLRGLFPAADPPWRTTVGVVWHDEGAWVHNARNRALFGTWISDAWNPVFIAPVFTALEYVSFAAFGVGVRQARLVPEVLGLLSVALLALGVARIAGRKAGLLAAALLGTNYVYVMWNRAALMEAPMAAFMVAGWYSYTRANENRWWALGAGACAWLAFFTKAAAAFFVAALVLDALWTLVLDRHNLRRRHGAVMTIAAVVGFGCIALVAFVWPNWSDYWFYNVQMSITRKPSYDLQSLLNRITWFPILHDLFTRMWATLVIAFAGLAAIALRWRRAHPGERLLFFWVVLGALELLLHDVGNERRFVFFIPAFCGLAAIVLGAERMRLLDGSVPVTRGRLLLAAPLIAYALYVVFGSIVRVAYLYEVRPNVRLAAALAIVATAALVVFWPRLSRTLGSSTWSGRAAAGLTILLVAGQLAQYVQWAAGRSYKNYEASLAIGRMLPPGTLVHGKLANGLALENGIRPVFVGRGFGNYDDRRTRDDVRYILTYTAPRLGYESQKEDPVILDVLNAYPNRSIIMTFDVAETATGHDRAALIDKFGGHPSPERSRSEGRARD